MTIVLDATLRAFGIPIIVALALYGLDWLAGWRHRRQANRRLTWK